MSLFRAYRNLPSKTKLGVGVGLLVWGVVGLYLSDRAEEKLGFKPTEADKAALKKMTPSITIADRRDRP